MDNKEILEKIFEKAGHDLQLLDFYCNKSDEELLIFDCIFSHDFAKAFWGEEEINLAVMHGVKGLDIEDFNNICIMIKNYEYHLQQMVLEKDPLRYLEKFL